MNKNTEIISITESAIMIALAVAFEFIVKSVGFLTMPQGGSFSLTMLPIMIIGLRRGIKYGLLTGLIYGFLNFVIDGFILHWGSLFLDYLFAFSVIGLTGLFNNKAKNNILFLVISILVVSLMRYTLHVLSGILFFREYLDTDGTIIADIIASLSYNIIYMLPSTLLCLIVGVLSRRIIYFNLKENI